MKDFEDRILNEVNATNILVSDIRARLEVLQIVADENLCFNNNAKIELSESITEAIKENLSATINGHVNELRNSFTQHAIGVSGHMHGSLMTKLEESVRTHYTGLRSHVKILENRLQVLEGIGPRTTL